MALPNAGNAVVDIAKLRDYCLSQAHMRGRHKARVFAAATGLTAADADMLRSALLDAAQTEDAVFEREDEFGRRYIVDFTVSGPAGSARVRSFWIVRAGEDFPRFTTCYVL